jgi:mono/diheme cytochrome c family protein
MKGTRAWILVLGCVAAAGCAAALDQPTSQDAEWASRRWGQTSVADLQQGRAIYVDKCAGCHNLHVPAQYKPEEWEGYVAYMTADAKLTPDEKTLITRFLVSASARARGWESSGGGEQ